MRIYGKTPMLSRLQIPVDEVEERRLRGIRLLMEELDLRDEIAEEEVNGGSLEEAAAGDAFIRSLMADVEGLAEGLTAEDQAVRGQEKNSRSSCRPRPSHCQR